ncbi:hypothetical protein THRCLA_20772 [Thraustotheca clavata]|uniref:Uncharacterized protein n=1 Tax=Thraustotheca clavata TaxID=74557 RepID=A0A1W0A3Q8_9STRA|nr:hypothetical protein THRCLA_20772 [Thraustotheca clavata]
MTLFESLPFYNASYIYTLDVFTINQDKVYNWTNPVIPFNAHIVAQKQYTAVFLESTLRIGKHSFIVGFTYQFSYIFRQVYNRKTTNILESLALTPSPTQMWLHIHSLLHQQRWNGESSLKMYWALGNDLKSILDNSTMMGGKSLLRSSTQFAFYNISLQEVYFHSTSLIQAPWHEIYKAQEAYLVYLVQLI